MPDGSPLPRFLLLYAALFAAFGVVSPFLPGLLMQDGRPPGSLGVVLACGTAIRLLAGPAGGRLADRSGRAATVLAGFTAIASLVALGYVPARGVAMLLLVSVAHAAVLAPLTPVADALALGSASPQGGHDPARPRGGRSFEYGWVRGAGSGAFIVGVIIWMNAGLLAAAAGFAIRLPNRVAGADEAAAPGSLRALIGIPVFVRLMLVAGLIGGSHAMHDSFEVIRWRAAGLSTRQASLLWSLSVAAEVIVFVLRGRRLLGRLGAGGALMLAAAAGVWARAPPDGPAVAAGASSGELEAAG